MRLERLFELVQLLRDPERGCPWDRVQTLETMLPPLREEVEELAEAIESGSTAGLLEEAGDVLWNLVTILAIAEERGLLVPQAAADSVERKMIERHPHVFGDVEAETVEEAIKAYLEAKAKR